MPEFLPRKGGLHHETLNVIGGRVFVGDRANDQVVVFDPDDFSVEATVPAGEGVFHMWAGIAGRQLWVNNDADNTATVVDVRTLDVLATVPMPADLVAMGGKPHDVIVERGGRYAYVTMLGFPGPHDYVVQYDTRTFTEVNRAAVGKDPHLSLTQRNNYLYTSTNAVLGSVDTPHAVPHNVALTPDGKKLYLTHSGATADKVTIYSASKREPVPVYAGEVTVGLNPFGLAYVP